MADERKNPSSGIAGARVRRGTRLRAPAQRFHRRMEAPAQTLCLSEQEQHNDDECQQRKKLDKRQAQEREDSNGVRGTRIP